jgi:hypothetical protein
LFAPADARMPAIFLAPWRVSARSIPPASILSLALAALIVPAMMLAPGVLLAPAVLHVPGQVFHR